MARFFLPRQSWSEEAWLEGDEAKHLSQVLRGRVGDEVIVFDGEGDRAEAEIREVSKGRVRLKLGEIQSSTALKPRLVLAIAIPKGKTMDLVVQKAVELGVAAIQPLVTKRTIAQPGEGKAEKWRRVALEACKQCGSDFLPEVDEPLDYGAWLAQGRDGLGLIASLAPGAGPMREVLRVEAPTDEITLLVGPEGDFTPEETATALERGWRSVTLGPTVLRTETAALYGLAALRFEYH